MKKAYPDKAAVGSNASDGLYDRHAPIPVAEAHESDTESVWALFQESSLPPEELALIEAARAKDQALHRESLSCEEVPTLASPLADGAEHDTGFAETSFGETGFSDAHFDLTTPAPLKPS